MSSVLVRGMEMPKNCEECDIHFCKLWMRMTIKQRIAGKHPDCPCIEVKTPHGRLIDADKFVYGKTDCFYETEMDLKNADTVIEAEE